jgi:hypothetical protein
MLPSHSYSCKPESFGLRGFFLVLSFVFGLQNELDEKVFRFDLARPLPCSASAHFGCDLSEVVVNGFPAG